MKELQRDKLLHVMSYMLALKLFVLSYLRIRKIDAMERFGPKSTNMIT